MALHGEIKVNNHIIGYWEAVRTGEASLAGKYLYACHVTLQETITNPEDFYDVSIRNHDLKFHLWHTFTDGALVLSSLVLKQAAKRIGMEAEDELVG